MKKLLLVAIFLMGWASAAMAATSVTASGTECLGANCTIVTYKYTITSVGTSSSTVFKINVPAIAGQIISWHFKSSSTDCDVFINGADSGVLADAYVGYAGFNPGGRPEVPGGATPYWNADTPQTAHLYATVKNDDSSNATGTGVLTITFKQ